MLSKPALKRCSEIMGNGLKHRLFINGEWKDGTARTNVHSPFSGEAVASVEQASAEHLETALSAAQKSFLSFRKTSRSLRSLLLKKMAEGIEKNRADLCARIVEEAGKPFMLADVEVSRAVGTFTRAAEEVKKFTGEMVPVDVDAGGRPYGTAVWHWQARGPVLGISPFNFPLNLVAHKVAPALAIGAPILLKPPPQAPGAAVLLAQIFEIAVREASDAKESVPLSAFQVIHAPNDVMAKAVSDHRISVLSFTGSDKVGWMLRDKASQKKVVLELGGNAAVIVHKDADLNRAAQRCAFGAFAYAGQICISVQRIFVQSSVAENFQSLFLKEVQKLVVGDPQNKDTLVGPVIDAGNADRILSWVAEAQKSGAKILTGGERKRNVIQPIVMTGVKPDAKVSCEEVFGPTVILQSYETFEDAMALVNSSSFGLQAGIFTDSAKCIQQATENLDVGGLIVNEIPTYRADPLPYGGMKNSGLGREGVKYAMEEYSERKTIVTYNG